MIEDKPPLSASNMRSQCTFHFAALVTAIEWVMSTLLSTSTPSTFVFDVFGIDIVTAVPDPFVVVRMPSLTLHTVSTAVVNSTPLWHWSWPAKGVRRLLRLHHHPLHCPHLVVDGNVINMNALLSITSTLSWP